MLRRIFVKPVNCNFDGKLKIMSSRRFITKAGG